MGIGYAASALHLISYLVIDETAPYTTTPPVSWHLPPMPGVRYMREPARFRSLAAQDIIVWRDRLAIKCRGQLGELLSWDETSDYSKSEEAATSADVLLRYVAAIADEGGPQALRGLVGANKPAHDEIDHARAGAERRGFTGRFRQLLLVYAFWLPFQRDMIIEEPDWQGKTERFGSSFRLEEEVRELREQIADADPRSKEWTSEREAPTRALWAAWQASETVARICAAATSLRLPLWTTG